MKGAISNPNGIILESSTPIVKRVVPAPIFTAVAIPITFSAGWFLLKVL
jgi:hypothetical protein